MFISSDETSAEMGVWLTMMAHTKNPDGGTPTYGSGNYPVAGRGPGYSIDTTDCGARGQWGAAGKRVGSKSQETEIGRRGSETSRAKGVPFAHARERRRRALGDSYTHESAHHDPALDNVAKGFPTTERPAGLTICGPPMPPTPGW